MDKMNCGVYGDLEWLEPEMYYEGPWSFIDVWYISTTSYAVYDDAYDIVENDVTGELRYTNI